MLLKEKVLKDIKENNDVKEVEEGDYITIFKRVGDGRIVRKTLNVKPDFIIHEFNNAVDYAFINTNLFDTFKVLNKLLLFRELNTPMDFKKLYFYTEHHEEVYINREEGIIVNETKYSTKELWNQVINLVKRYERKLQKEIILKIIE
ncbi:hypothetical protein COZ55_00435 [archaeon CG_4_8_14_3_um_filter_38_5]|nr:MAG: hypothetical protein COS83_00445 [archaeon CG07_land_8_20_14_0_80_38_8]PIU89263.1 MAG: hypothetical protein COS64_01615 [archaeon CG06_land_8_20_14_3_00_37_11]PIX44382.1 MAG: hypothetical protein COZ55_00435 [archaeon CG_4_8_14_3_um_filter_38_5]